jgi:hypothetical protein
MKSRAVSFFSRHASPRRAFANLLSLLGCNRQVFRYYYFVAHRYVFAECTFASFFAAIDGFLGYSIAILGLAILITVGETSELACKRTGRLSLHVKLIVV